MAKTTKKKVPMITKKMRKERLLIALEKSLGVVTSACKSIGYARETFYTYYHTDDEFRAKADDIQNIAADFVESRLYQNIQNGDVASTIFYCKTKLKHRGYVEKIQQEVSGELNLNIEIVPYEKEDNGS